VLNFRTGHSRTLAINLPTAWILGIAFTPDGQKIVADATDGLHVWEVAPPGTIVESDAAQPGTGSVMAVDPGVKTAIVGYPDGSIAGFDVSGTRRLGQAFAWETPSLSCAGDTGGPCDAVSQHTDLLADTRSDGTVAIVNLHTLRLARILPDHIGDDDAVAWLPDGRTLVHGELNGELRFWDVTTGRITRTFRFADTVEQVTVSRDGKLLAVETQGAHSTGSRVALVQSATGRVLQTHSVPDSSIGVNVGLEFSRDGRELIALGLRASGSSVVVWDVRSGRRLWSREGVSASAMDITSDSRLLGLGTQDGQVLFLDLLTGQQAQPSLQASDRSIAFVAFSPDGHTLVVADDQAVNLWDLGSRKPVGDTFGPYAAYTPQLALEPNGRLLIVLGGNAEQWPTDVATWERFACGIVGRNLIPAEWADVLPNRAYRVVCSG
jgi:WD40 repeat protein